MTLGRPASPVSDVRASLGQGHRRDEAQLQLRCMNDSAETEPGGFFARSQALKADALDFLGDGSITLVGLFALGWAEHTRARVALTQGCFLLALGIGVLGAAIWRATNAIPPEADVMGILGVAGLLVNLAAAAALIRFRKVGGANARAIWLFSRNDTNSSSPASPPRLR